MSVDLLVCIVLSELLPPPSGLEAEPVNETAVQLSWKRSTSDVGPVTGYTVVYAAFVSSASNLSHLSLNDPSASSLIRY